MRRSVRCLVLFTMVALLLPGAVRARVEAGFSKVVVFGSNSVWLEHLSQVNSGDVVANDASPGPTLHFGKELAVGQGAVVAAGSTLKADSIRIFNQAIVQGAVFCNDLDDASASVTCSPLPLPVFASFPLFFTGPSNGPDVVVGKDQTVTLAAGDYGLLSVSKGGVVRFTGGVYNVRKIDAALSSALVFLAPSAVRVAETFSTAQDSSIGPSPGSGVAASEIVFYVAGINGSDGLLTASPKAATIGVGNVVGANFYVPNGTLWLRHGTVATGAFLGRDVDVDMSVKLALASAFFNHPPVAVGDAATVDEGGSVSLLDSGAASLLANDSDPDLDNLAVSATPVSGPTHGTVVLNADGTFTYTHDGSETLADSFVYQVCDDGVEPGPLCSTATVTITVRPVNDPPVAVGDSATVNRGGTVSQLDSAAASVLANDSDPDSSNLTASLVSGPAHAFAFSFNPDGTFSYTHDGGTDASDAFVYQVCDDGAPPLCASATVAITIRQELVTFAVPQTVETAVDTPVVITMTGGADSSRLPLTFSIVAGPAHGSVTTPPTTLSPTSARTTYSPAAGFTGDDSFTFQVEDSAGGTATAVVSIAVSDETGGQAVLAVSQSVTTDQGTPIEIALRATTTLEETVTITIATSPAHGTLGPLSPDPSDPNAQLVTYTPNAGFSGSDGFTFEACVSAGCDIGTISITVRPASLRVTITKQGAGSGRVSSLPAGIDCGAVCSASFGATETISLFAAADEGSVFAGWSGDADCADGQLTPDSDKSCIATFDLFTPPTGDVRVSVSIAGTGNGHVLSDPDGIDCGSLCEATFPAFQRVDLFPVADPGSEFAGWSGSADCADGSLNGAGDVSCVATFNLLPPVTYTLTVNISGTGGGTVASSPLGISCPGTCVASFVPGTVVTLSARADEDGSVFAGWSGDCVVDPVFPFRATVTLDGNKVCGAVFTNG